MDVASLYSIAPDYLAREYDWNASGEASGKNDFGRCHEYD